MKLFWLTIFLALSSAMLKAQTNLPSSSAPTLRGKTDIQSHTADFDLKTRQVIYRGNVRVTNPQMKLWCELLTAMAPPAGGRIENIVAETNVVIEMQDENGQTNHAFGEKLVYTYKVADGVTNEVAVLTGNPTLKKPDMTITGDAIEWDRQNNQLHVTNQKMTFTTEAVGMTNTPPPAIEAPKQ